MLKHLFLWNIILFLFACNSNPAPSVTELPTVSICDSIKNNADFLAGDTLKHFDQTKGIPKNLKESFVVLDSLTSPKFKQYLECVEEDALINFHFGLGMWLRNNWGLWAGSELNTYFQERDIFHPDDMSSIIITSYYRYIHQKELKLDEQVDFFKQYWKKEAN